MLANRHQLRTGTGSNAAALQTESKATSEGSSKEKHASELERALSAAEGEVVRLTAQLEKISSQPGTVTVTTTTTNKNGSTTVTVTTVAE